MSRGRSKGGGRGKGKESQADSHLMQAPSHDPGEEHGLCQNQVLNQLSRPGA